MNDVQILPAPVAKVAVCVPVQDFCPPMFAYDLARMVAFTTLNFSDVELHLLFCSGSQIAQQRARLAEAVVASGVATHILWLDADMRFPVDTLARLLAHAVPVVCASYTERRPPFQPVAIVQMAEGDLPEVRAWPTPESSGLRQIMACGMGVMLMETRVLSELERPWFNLGYNPTTRGYIGEDAYCSMKINTVAPIMLDQDLTKEVLHIGRFEFGPEHAMQYGEERGLIDEAEPVRTPLALVEG